MKRRSLDRAALAARTATGVDARLRVATPLRGILNRVFPDHWSFLLGEIAAYSLVVLIVTGTFLSLFFEPSMRDVVYQGSYTPLRGTHMSAAYASTLDLSFDVRGGLLMRQMHHWAAMLFIATILVYLLRVFFTGAFRRPRELKWIVGLLLFWTALVTSYTGYMMMDDGMSGTGMQILSSILMSVPVAGSWLASSVFGGEFPGDVIVERFNTLHVVLLPGLLIGLMLTLVALRFRHGSTQWAGPRRTETNIVGRRLFPGYGLKQVGLFLIVCAVIVMLGGLFQINPIWLFGPAHPAATSALSQPAWYLMFLDGAVRIMPPWELSIAGYTVHPIFWAAVVLPTFLVAMPMAYPFIEARVRRDHREHHLLDRPRDVPGRTALGAMALAFYLVLTLSGAGDAIALTFHISTNAVTWAGRIGLVLLPPLAYWVTHRVCLALQQHDREVLVHGVETGIIRRMPDGGFTEVHQPLAPGALSYIGRPVPKKMNEVGALAPAAKGFLKPLAPSSARAGDRAA
jgi:ubiquinol-cytochrome c reductase cytochrome b subunit